MSDVVEAAALKTLIALLAVKLLGRQHVDEAPEGHWCRSAIDTHGSETKGPWFKYRGDTNWQCELCYEDLYLSEYGEKYLLGPAGMIALIEAMREQGHDLTMQTRYDGESGCWAHLAKLEAPYMSFHVDGGMHRGQTFPEAVARAAFASLSE